MELLARSCRPFVVVALLAVGSAPAPSAAQALAPGDLWLTCVYWGVTRIALATGEQKPLGVGVSGQVSPIAVDADGTIWVVDNRWLIAIDSATGDHRAVLQLGNEIHGELVAEPGGTLLYAGAGAVSRIDPMLPSVTPLAAGAPLSLPLGLARSDSGEIFIADPNAGAIFRLVEGVGVTTVTSGAGLLGPSKVRVLPDGDLLVAHAGSPLVSSLLRVDPLTGDRSDYAPIEGASTAAVADDGSVFTSNSGGIWRIAAPGALPELLLATNANEPVAQTQNLALTPDARLVVASFRNENPGRSFAALFLFDPLTPALRVLSQRPPQGGIGAGGDGSLYVADGPGLRSVDPRSGETTLVASGTSLDATHDAAVEGDGQVLVLNGTSGVFSVLRVEPVTGTPVPLAANDRFVAPHKLVVSRSSGRIFVGDITASELIEIDPVSGAQSAASDPAQPQDLEPEAGDSVLFIPQTGVQLVRADLASGALANVGPLLSSPPAYALGIRSGLALAFDGTPYVTLTTDSGGQNALYRTPLGDADPTFVAELPLCPGAGVGTQPDLELVRAVPTPEPASRAAAAAALATLAALARMRRASGVAQAGARYRTPIPRLFAPPVPWRDSCAACSRAGV